MSFYNGALRLDLEIGADRYEELNALCVLGPDDDEETEDEADDTHDLDDLPF